MSPTRYLPETRYSEAVTFNDLIFLSGQVPTNPEADIQAQTQDVLAQIDTTLAALNTSKAKLIDATVYLRNLDADYTGFNQVWDAWLPTGQAPARACVEAKLANPNWKVEIKLIVAQ
jgi:enamine deaminase RidA (YjgF/YER057c/UK114 family)